MTATLVYDGDCGFCTWVAGLGERVLPAAVTIVPWQKADLAALGLSAEAVRDAVQWVPAVRGDPAGPGGAGAGEGAAQPAHRALPAQAGHRAIAAWFLASGLPWSVLGRVLLLPGISWCAARVYSLISINRHRIPGPWRRGGRRCGVG
jgi:predicted DCC family thiol-disulfide oxidoreductase YuxK